jgi:hypothetical protein
MPSSAKCASNPNKITNPTKERTLPNTNFPSPSYVITIMVLSSRISGKTTDSLRREGFCSKELETKKANGKLWYIKRTKSTSVCTDIDLAPCVNPINTIFSTL